MKRFETVHMRSSMICTVCLLVAGASARAAMPADDAPLGDGVRAVWDLKQAYREATPTRERICINGLWRWQPAENADGVPAGRWGFFKVPGCWPGAGDYMQHDCQTLYAHPSWKDAKLGGLAAAWYQREISVPKEWAGRRVTLRLEYLNSSATVFIDGAKAGEAQFPAGEVDLTAVCPPGSKHTLSLRVVAKPLREVMLMFNDTNAARGGIGKVERRGLCGDVYLIGAPRAARIGNVKVETSVRKGQVTFSAALENLTPHTQYTLRAVISDHGQKVREFTGKTFEAGDLQNGRFELSEKWKPEKLWDLHTPQNVYEAAVSLVALPPGERVLTDGGIQPKGGTTSAEKLLDAALPVRFGFRELWIDGRDFYLNGTRIFLSALPLDNAQVERLDGQLRGGQREPAAAEADRHQLRLYPQLWLRAGKPPELRGDSPRGGRRRDARGPLAAPFCPVRLEDARRGGKKRLRAPRQVLCRRGGKPPLRSLLCDEPQRDRLRRRHGPGPDRRHPRHAEPVVRQ